jgi:hypothetical protein
MDAVELATLVIKSACRPLHPTTAEIPADELGIFLKRGKVGVIEAACKDRK